MRNTFITFIGAGNMANSLIGGLIADGYDPKRICAADPNLEKLKNLQKKFGINITTKNNEAVANANVIIFAVKPQILKIVATELSNFITEKKPLIISVAAMIPSTHIEKWLQNAAIVRCMPNTPALIRCGATGLLANRYVTSEQKNLAESIMRAVGITVWVNNEEQIDIVTALSGSGPAYFFLLMEMLQQSAEKLGLPAETARLLTLQTALGAARLALESNEDVTTLRKQVTSPGGTTERAIGVLESGNIRELFFEALQAAQLRALELIKNF